MPATSSAFQQQSDQFHVLRFHRILFSFDWVSLHQVSRAIQEEKEFKKALGLINFLYYDFGVLLKICVEKNTHTIGSKQRLTASRCKMSMQ